MQKIYAIQKKILKLEVKIGRKSIKIGDNSDSRKESKGERTKILHTNVHEDTKSRSKKEKRTKRI